MSRCSDDVGRSRVVALSRCVVGAREARLGSTPCATSRDRPCSARCRRQRRRRCNKRQDDEEMEVLTSGHAESVLVWVRLDEFVVLGRVARVCGLRVDENTVMRAVEKEERRNALSCGGGSGLSTWLAVRDQPVWCGRCLALNRFRDCRLAASRSEGADSKVKERKH